MTQNLLHIHSFYSLFDCPQSADDICRRAKEIRAENVTLTDHGTLLGIDDFMEAGKKYGVNTIPGVEAYAKDRCHLILVAVNYEGFQAISFAMRDANTRLQKAKFNKTIAYPIMEDDILEKYFKGNRNVIATTACMQGPLSSILLSNGKTQRLVDRHEKVMSDCLSAHETYHKDTEEIDRLNARARVLRTDRKKQERLCGKTSKKKLIKLRKEMEEEENFTQMNLLNEKSRTEELFRDLQSQIELAEETIQAEDRELLSIKTKLSGLREERRNAKAASERWERAEEACREEKKSLKDDKVLYQEAKDRLLYLKSVFPRLFVELQYHGIPEEARTAPVLLQLADETNTPVIAANDAHITDSSEDSIEARRILRFNYFKRAETVSDGDRELYIKTDEELLSALSQVIPEDRAKEAIRNTSVLAECHVEFLSGEHYPKTNDGITLEELLDEAVEEKKKIGAWSPLYQERLDHELSIIQQMGFSDYYLVVRDFCNAARVLGVVPSSMRDQIPADFQEAEAWIRKMEFQDGVGVGPGRGSAAGSLVCYLLGITNLDPVKYDLLFERFLNPERVTMPDIDSDIAKGIRPAVLRYLRYKYGERAVCSIATTNTYGGKGAVKMAGRDRASQLYGTDKNSVEKIREYNKQYVYPIADAIPNVPNSTLDSCEEELSPLIHSCPETELIWKHAKLIEGVPFATGIHAGGVIISDNENVNEYVPLAWSTDEDGEGVWVAQCDMVRAEEKGLLKMDLLGLNTLDIITDCVQLIGSRDGIHVDLDHLPFEPEVFSEIYDKGFTSSVFQFESEGMKRMLRDFKPTCFEDLILLVAAYRPGPMQYLDDIIEVKNGRKPLSYRHPALESILSQTYGAVIYQEQVMQIFQKLAGYSLGGADLVRRAMGKKKMDKLAHEKEAFIYGDKERGIDGCVNRGISAELAGELFEEMMEFAKYAFNKSHAATYAFVSYQTAWLKYHFPAEFACAMLNNKEQKDFGPVLSDCIQSGIQVLPPDMNRSFYDFTLEPSTGGSASCHSVRYGFKGIKGIGKENKGFIRSLIQERNENGPFLSIQDFLLRTVSETPMKNGKTLYHTISQKYTSLFIESGLFDFTKQDRESLEEVFGRDFRAESMESLQENLFGTEVSCIKTNTHRNLELEYECLGTVLSVHPLDDYREASLYGCAEISDMTPGSHCSIFGALNHFEESVSRRGEEQIEMEVQGKTGLARVYVSGWRRDAYYDFLKENLFHVIKISGTVLKNGAFRADRVDKMSGEAKWLCIPFLSYQDQCTLLRLCGREGRKLLDKKENPIRAESFVREGKSGKKFAKPITLYFPEWLYRRCQESGIVFSESICHVPDYDVSCSARTEDASCSSQP